MAIDPKNIRDWDDDASISAATNYRNIMETPIENNVETDYIKPYRNPVETL